MDMPRSEKRIKVLFVIDKWKAGGRQRVLQRLINSMDATAFEAVLLVLSEPHPSFPLPNARICTLPITRYRSAIIPLARIFRVERPNVVSPHLGVLMVPVVSIAVLISRVHTAVVHSIQSVFDLTTYAQTSFPRINKFVIAWSLRTAAAITVGSEGAKVPLSQEFGIPLSLMHMVPNPVYESENHRSRDFRSTQKAVRILTVGRLAYPKDFSTVMRSFKNAQQRSEAPLSLSIIGGGQDGEKLRTEARDLGIGDSVFRGETVVDSETFENADIFIFSSRSEGMPVVLIEALASGVPVIATDCDFGPRDVIKNGTNGFLIPVGDVGAMTDAILQLSRDPELMRTFSEAGPDSVKKFEVSNAVRKWQQLFRDTLIR